ncbi:ribosomal maturation YjgA family protein [Agromyces sp. NPDC055520]
MAAAVCLLGGLGLQLVPRTVVIDLLGSVLYVGLVAFALRAAWPRLGPVRSSAIAFAAATAIELLQLTGLPQRVVEAVPLTRLVLGSSFDAIDLVAYAAGALLAFVVQLGLTARRADRVRATS